MASFAATCVECQAHHVHDSVVAPVQLAASEQKQTSKLSTQNGLQGVTTASWQVSLTEVLLSACLLGVKGAAEAASHSLVVYWHV